MSICLMAGWLCQAFGIVLFFCPSYILAIPHVGWKGLADSKKRSVNKRSYVSPELGKDDAMSNCSCDETLPKKTKNEHFARFMSYEIKIKKRSTRDLCE